VRRQATLSDQEIRDLLIGRSRLDEFINFTYRALKSHRDGLTDAARLDSAESVASMLDVVFSLSARVRPYNKYLAWELSKHPLPGADWQDGRLLRCVNGLLEGSEAAVRESFLAVERECHAYEKRVGQCEMSEVIDAWGEELRLLRGLRDLRQRGDGSDRADPYDPNAQRIDRTNMQPSGIQKSSAESL
jgi:hypothetical protein